MENKSIGFVKYLKLSQESDAFFDCEKLSPFFDLEIFGIFSSTIIKQENYTAGTTTDPDDYDLPDISLITLPNRLLRLNSFNKNQKNKIISIDNKEQSEYKIPDLETKSEEETFLENNFIATDAFKLFSLMKIKNIKENKVIQSNKIVLSSNIPNKIEFEIGERKYVQNTIVEQSSDNRPILNINGSGDNTTNIQNIEEIVNKNIDKYDYNTTINASRIQSTNSTDFSYDVYSSTTSSYNDFSSVNNNTQIIQEVKEEIISNVNQSINNINSTINNHQQITKQEINNVENKIVQVIEQRLEEQEAQIVDKISEKSKKDLAQFKRDLLNS